MLAKLLASAYYSSACVKAFVKIIAFFSRMFSGSKILSVFLHSDKLQSWWENSRTYSFLELLIDFPGKLVPRGLTHKISIFLSEKFYFAVGSFIAIVIIIPHKFWHNIYSTAAAVCFAGLLTIIRLTAGKESPKLRPINFMFAVFMFLTGLSVITSLYPAASLRVFMFYLTCYIFVFVMAGSIQTADKLQGFVEIMLTGVTLCGLYGVFQAVQGVPVDPFLIDIRLNKGMPGRVFSTLDNPNNLAEVFVLTLPFYVSTILNSKSLFKKLVYCASMLPPLLALGFTYARSCWGAFVIGMIIFIFIKNYRLIPLAFAGGLAALPLVPDSIFNRLITVIGMRDTTFIFRGLVYRTIVPIIKDFWLVGLGLGPAPFMAVYGRYFMYTDAIKPTHSHNLFLEIWLELGLAGIIVFLWLIFRIFKKSMLSISRPDADKALSNTLLAGIASMTGILITGLVEYVWFYPRVMLVFWIVFGIMLTALAIEGEKGKGVLT